MKLQFYLSSMLVWATCGALLMASSAQAQQFCRPNGVETAPASDFIDNGDGTATHIPTRLMWKRCIQGQRGDSCQSGVRELFAWQEALEEAQNETFAGHSDWRLPNIKELISITEYNCTLPATNLSILPTNRVSGLHEYWSSTPFINRIGVVNFSYSQNISNGFPKFKSRDERKVVRLVRDIGQ